MTVDAKDMADLSIPTFSAPQAARLANGTSPALVQFRQLTHSGTSSRFQTDADISGNQNRGERKLQKWVPEAIENTDLALGSGGNGEWDQFKANQQLFGTQSSYDESYYTTSIDRSSESYKQREARANKLAREIEGSQSNNQHLREERGQTSQLEAEDEEAKYSGVRRDQYPPLPKSGTDKYTPPARRAPTGAPTIPGAPFDSAIVSAQLSRPEGKAPAQARQQSPLGGGQSQSPSVPVVTSHEETPSGTNKADSTLAKEQQQIVDSRPEGVEDRLLSDFRQFADSEKQKVFDKKRAQAQEEKRQKLQELLQFSKDFKLKTVVPRDLVGILAKDPAKQEAIVLKSHKDVETPQATPQPTPSKETTIRKADIAQIPPFQGGRGRGLPTSASMRLPQQANMPIRGSNGPRPGKGDRIPGVPAPIPLVEPRGPPGTTAVDPALGSPSRSNIQTPMSAIAAAKFNLNVRASEFKPTAPAFNPGGSNAPSSPASIAKASSISRAATPSSFFGNRKLKPFSQRSSVMANFQTINKLQQDHTEALTRGKSQKGSDATPPVKDYTSTGGIVPAYLAQPRWTVSAENEDKTYLTVFERPATVSPNVSRTGSAQAVPYHQQTTGGPNMAGMGPQPIPQAYGQNYEEQRMPMMPPHGQVYASPSFTSRQPSSYASPMGHPAQLAYGHQPYYGGQVPMPMRQFPSNPHNQQSAPMMMQQQSSGPYMNMPQQFNGQMAMYSPSPGHAYPQQNGYGSPGRAPMMMQQGSQQGHSQPMMWSTSAQGGPMYGQPAQMNMYRGYQAQYGSSPQQQFQQQRAGSYGQVPHHKMMHMQHAMGQEDGK